jgi:hypothetical protein
MVVACKQGAIGPHYAFLSCSQQGKPCIFWKSLAYICRVRCVQFPFY